MQQKVLHIVFGSSPAGILRRALYDLDVDEKVVDIMDDFSVGPIASDSFETRKRWMVEQLRDVHWPEVVEDDIELPARCRTRRGHMIAWFAPNRAESHAGFLWWLSEIGMRPCSVMSVPDLHFCGTEAMIELVGREVALGDVERRRYHAEWADLKKDNAELRIVHEEHVVSVGAEFFDKFIYAYLTPEWQDAHRIILRSTSDLSMETGHFLGHLYAFWRLRRFADGGGVEFYGDESDMCNCKVRLMESHASVAVGA